MSRPDIGKKVYDLAPLLDLFEAQEGIVEHIIGKTGMGKTYEATRRALKYLFSGYTVYTTWQLNLPDYYDEREHFWPVFRNLILFKKNFFRFDLKNNWHYIDIDRPDLVEFVASLTDCIVMLDEGQDIFDSHDRATKAARKTITRTRHMHKTLIIISQRAQAVDVTARANVTFFYQCKKVISWPWAFFRVYYTEEIDDSNNYPLWRRLNSIGEVTWQAPVYHSGFARRRIYNAYDSWYLRQNMLRSQSIKLDAYNTHTLDKLRLLFYFFIPYRQKKVVVEPQKKLVKSTIQNIKRGVS